MSSFSVICRNYGFGKHASGDVWLKVLVEKSQVESALPFMHPVLDDAQLKVTFDVEGVILPDPDKEERNKLIAQIHIQADEIGYSEAARRKAYKNITGKETLVDMDLGELQTVEKEFYAELNPVGEPS